MINEIKASYCDLIIQGCLAILGLFNLEAVRMIATSKCGVVECNLKFTILVYSCAATWACTHELNKELAGSRTKIERSMFVKHHIPGQNNKHLGKRKDKGHRRD